MTMHEPSGPTSSRITSTTSCRTQERRAVAAHVAECAECARTLDELRAVVEPRTCAGAGRAVDRPLARHRRPHHVREAARPVPATVGARRDSRSRWPELVAASIAAGARFRMGATAPDRQPARRRVPTFRSASPRAEAPSDLDVVPASFDDTEYDAAVADLRACAATRARPARSGDGKSRRGESRHHRPGGRRSASRARTIRRTRI